MTTFNYSIFYGVIFGFPFGLWFSLIFSRTYGRKCYFDIVSQLVAGDKFRGRLKGLPFYDYAYKYQKCIKLIAQSDLPQEYKDKVSQLVNSKLFAKQYSHLANVADKLIDKVNVGVIVFNLIAFCWLFSRLSYIRNSADITRFTLIIIIIGINAIVGKTLQSYINYHLFEMPINSAKVATNIGSAEIKHLNYELNHQICYLQNLKQKSPAKFQAAPKSIRKQLKRLRHLNQLTALIVFSLGTVDNNYAKNAAVIYVHNVYSEQLQQWLVLLSRQLASATFWKEARQTDDYKTIKHYGRDSLKALNARITNAILQLEPLLDSAIKEQAHIANGVLAPIDQVTLMMSAMKAIAEMHDTIESRDKSEKQD